MNGRRESRIHWDRGGEAGSGGLDLLAVVWHTVVLARKGEPVMPETLTSGKPPRSLFPPCCLEATSPLFIEGPSFFLTSSSIKTHSWVKSQSCHVFSLLSLGNFVTVGWGDLLKVPVPYLDFIWSRNGFFPRTRESGKPGSKWGPFRVIFESTVCSKN